MFVLLTKGAFPSCCGAEASSSLLAEEDILAKLPPEVKVNILLHKLVHFKCTVFIAVIYCFAGTQ